MVLGDTATGNSILRNSISANGSPGGLGIELNNNGVTFNDGRDPDAGPNTLQNSPVITSAGATTIKGNLNSYQGRLLPSSSSLAPRRISQRASARARPSSARSG